MTVNAPASVADWPSGLVTLTSRAPTGAPSSTLTLTVRRVSSSKTTASTVTPLPLKATSGSSTKPAPEMVRSPLAPCAASTGLSAVTVGGGGGTRVIAKPPGRVAD